MHAVQGMHAVHVMHAMLQEMDARGMTLGLSSGLQATQYSQSKACSALQSCSLSAEAGRGLRSSHRSSAASSSLSSDQPG